VERPSGPMRWTQSCPRTRWRPLCTAADDITGSLGDWLRWDDDLARLSQDRRCRDGQPRVADERRELVPVDRDVEVHAQPPTVTHVWRPEEALWSRGDQRFLGTGWCRQPRGTTVVVMPIRRIDELPRPDEPARLTMADALGRIRERQADRPESTVWIDRQIARIRLFLASCVSSAFPSASRSGGRYIPNRPR